MNAINHGVVAGWLSGQEVRAQRFVNQPEKGAAEHHNAFFGPAVHIPKALLEDHRRRVAFRDSQSQRQTAGSPDHVGGLLVCE